MQYVVGGAVTLVALGAVVMDDKTPGQALSPDHFAKALQATPVITRELSPQTGR